MNFVTHLAVIIALADLPKVDKDCSFPSQKSLTIGKTSQ